MKLHRAVCFLAFGLLLLVIPVVLSSPSAAQIGIGISVRIGPPALPVYEQPICPGEGYLWAPGYWSWSDDDGYYWVPGTWVEAPEPGLLWTPGYWGWNDGVYAWNGGYWGPQVGFYGGINYGFGYGGNGFYGGEWRSGHFFYNTAVMHVNTTQITNVYVNRTVIVNNNSHVAFNGGQGGISARPSAQEEAYSHEHHTAPVAAQVQQRESASKNRALFASTNHGRPAVAATAKPGEFSGRGVVAAKAAGGTYHAPAMSPKAARASAPAENRGAETRPAENRPAEKPAAENRTPSNGAKAENRPSTPPKSNTAKRPENASQPENTTRENTAPAKEARPSAERPTENHAAKATPAPKAHASAPAKESEPRAETARPASKPRAESAPRPEPKARESAPKESAPKAAPKESAPKESAPRPSTPKPSPKPSAAPKPQKPSAPPKQESAPKEEHKGR